MAQPAWRLVRKLKIPARPPDAAVWTTAVDVIEGPRLLRISTATNAGGWNPSPSETCSANGILDGSGSRLAPNASRGALIGKLGGSTSDLPSGDPAKYDSARVFAVGANAVIRIQKDEIAPLYFTMNDTPANFAQHAGEIEILLEEMDL